MNLSTASQPLSLYARDTLYIGIDIGKRRHVAGFVCDTLLRQRRRFEQCPTLPVENSRAGFTELLAHIDRLVPRAQARVLVEHTGHYHRDLVEFLQEAGIACYIVHVSRRVGMLKSDIRDALVLANALYNQLEKAVQSADRKAAARPVAKPSPCAVRLRGLVRHRYELAAEASRRRNKLTAILDELFPEFATVFKNPNLPLPRALRQIWPRPQDVARADTAALATHARDSRDAAKIAALARLAQDSIGTQDQDRARALCFEQRQLLAELDLIERHMAEIDAEIAREVAGSREGQILLSCPRIGVQAAATLLAAIGHISHFPNAAALKSYCGWAPKLTQTGTTKNSMALGRGGRREVKRAIFMAALGAIHDDTEWRRLYERLLPSKCQYDPRIKDYRGKLKVVGRVCGQIIELIYMLLRTDADLLAQLPAGQEPPPPTLYSRAVHQRHREGGYAPARPGAPPPAARGQIVPFPTPGQ